MTKTYSKEQQKIINEVKLIANTGKCIFKCMSGNCPLKTTCLHPTNFNYPKDKIASQWLKGKLTSWN